MAYEDKVVDVEVTLGTQPIDTVGFETPMFLAVHNNFPERLRLYGSVESLVGDGFAVGSAAYQFASNAFGGSFAPQLVAIGRMSMSGSRIDFTGTTNTERVVVNITINKVVKAITITINPGNTPGQIATALAEGINNDVDLAGRVTATVEGSTVVVVQSAEIISVGKGEGSYKIVNTSVETVATVLPQVLAENHNWYFLSHEQRSDADIVAAAEFAQANYKLHVYNSSDSDALAAANQSASVFDTLKALGYNSLGTYDKEADVEFTEGSVIGAMAANDPSYGDSIHLKTMPGMKPSTISETQRSNAWGRNANIYRAMYGTNSYIEGRTSSGQYVDVIRFSHWLKFRMEESVFGYMKRRSDQGQSMKMSDEDLPVLRSILFNNPINIGIRNGGILTGYDTVNRVSYDPIITIPRRAEIPSNDLANRILRDVKVEVVYNNSLHYVKIRAAVVLDRPQNTTQSTQTPFTNSTVGV
ncbi:structural protein [Escherichia phage A7_1]|uniref:Structural protein n=1 Tax=Escherichia phage A73 TaxID=3003819 RepID=A0AAE9VXZ7_9CAUD|nr:structural protein [Escherichia phage A7_1]WBF77552.1 structural protein [Escherichia phage A73]WBF77816.1 structural protein [Escherichia phage W70]